MLGKNLNDMKRRIGLFSTAPNDCANLPLPVCINNLLALNSFNKQSNFDFFWKIYYPLLRKNYVSCVCLKSENTRLSHNNHRTDCSVYSTYKTSVAYGCVYTFQ